MAEQSYFILDRPDEISVPIVFNSPHSGRDYPLDFIRQSPLDSHTLRKSEDFLVDELFARVTQHGAPLLRALFPRAWLDVNREPYELDPAMFAEPLPSFVNATSTRVTSGLGTIARIVAESREIYSGPLLLAEALHRIEHVYKPYHAALRNLLANSVVRFGHGILVDCHSMPSSSHAGRNAPFGLGRSDAMRADIILGDRYGNACSPFLTHEAAAILRGLGFRVAINKPYAGGFITEHYGRPGNGLHALQIEVNRALYMDETRIERLPGFDDLASRLESFSEGLIEACQYAQAEFAATTPLAAE